MCRNHKKFQRTSQICYPLAIGVLELSKVLGQRMIGDVPLAVHVYKNLLQKHAYHTHRKRPLTYKNAKYASIVRAR